jgi:hypothetical protein
MRQPSLPQDVASETEACAGMASPMRNSGLLIKGGMPEPGSTSPGRKGKRALERVLQDDRRFAWIAGTNADAAERLEPSRIAAYAGIGWL